MVKIFEDAITPACVRALDILRRHELIRAFYLAGGTALALQIGHRISTDLDWFSASERLLEPWRDDTRSALSESGEFEVASEQDGMLYARLSGADVSFVYQHHPLLERPTEYRGIMLASPTDVGLMKLAAIISRGTRRDFVDLHCLRGIASLDRLFELSAEKYRDRPGFLSVLARALVYFDDAEAQPMPQMRWAVRWKDVRAYCEDAARRLVRHLSGLD